MFSTSTTLVGIFIAFVVYLLWKSTRRPKNFPPGLPVWPIVGNMFQLGIKSYETVLNLRKEFGDIQGHKFFSYWTVFLNNPEDIRELLGKPECSARNTYSPILDATPQEKNYGLIGSTGQKWVQHRRFTLKTLRDFGFAKQGSESIIMEEVRELRESLRQKVGKPLENKCLFNVAVFNVIWCILAGERFPHEDPRVKGLVKIFEDFLESFQSGLLMVLFLFPTLRKIRDAVPFLFPSNTDGTKLRDELFQFFRESLKQHRATHQEGQPRDYIDAMIDEEIKEGNFEEMDYLVTLMDFFLAGSETTSTTMRWTMFLMAKHPAIQEKIVQELLSVTADRDVCLADRPNMPYVDAVTQEIFRLSTLVPNGVAHSTSEEVTFKGYTIPKDAMIFTNIYACHFSKELWGDPENFRPERFMDQGNKVGTRSKAWIPFGVGKRSCLGESLARDEFFLFFTNLTKSFRISFPKGEPDHGLDGVFSGVRTCVDHNLMLQERN